MNMALEFKAASKSAHLTPEQVEEFGRRVEEIRLAVMQNLGEEDSKYIYKVRDFVRYTEWLDSTCMVIRYSNVRCI